MTTTVIGATGRIGSAVVQRLVEAGQTVRVLVRNPGKAGQLFGTTPAVEIVHAQLDDPAAVAAGLAKSGTAFLAMGSIGLEANLQRVAIQAAASTPDLRQLVRLSVLNAGPDSLGINQRGHWSIDFAAQVASLPYTTIRPAIFSASLLAGAPEIKATRTWTGLAGTGRVALCDPRDVADAAARVLSDPSTWGQHHDLTGPRQVSWPEALGVLRGTGRDGDLPHHRRVRAGPAAHRRGRAGRAGGTARHAGMGDHGGRERAGHHRRARPDRARAADHRGLPAREP